MATPPEHLAFRMRGAAGNQQVLLYDNGADVSQLGDDLGTVATGFSVSSTAFHRNYAIKYNGRIFGVSWDGIYEKDDPTTDTGAYTQAFAFTIPQTTALGRIGRSGLYPMRIGSEPRLVCIYNVSTATYRAVIYNPSTNAWSEGDTGTPGGGAISVYSTALVFNNTLHIVGSASNAERNLQYDPGTDGFTSVVDPFPSNDLTTGMFIHKNRLFAIANDGTDNRLAELTGGQWTFVKTLKSRPTGTHLQS